MACFRFKSLIILPILLITLSWWTMIMNCQAIRMEAQTRQLLQVVQPGFSTTADLPEHSVPLSPKFEISTYPGIPTLPQPQLPDFSIPRIPQFPDLPSIPYLPYVPQKPTSPFFPPYYTYPAHHESTTSP